MLTARTILVAALQLAACAQLHAGVARAKDPKATVVPVFLVTDRSRTGSSQPAKRFGNRRGVSSYGELRVTVPIEKNSAGVAPERESVFDKGSGRKVALRELDALSDTEFFDRLADSVAAAEDRSILIYVHGAMTSFADSARVAARLTDSLGYRGTSILYSWPSAGSLTRYVEDGTNARWTVQHLTALLRELAARSGADAIHIVGHSMGNRAVVDALIGLADEDAARPTGEIVFVAPDLDREIFERDLAPRLRRAGYAMTLYVSSKDYALRASSGLNAYPRLGFAKHGVAVIEGLETIDVSEVNQVGAAHDYHKDNQAAIGDLRYLIIERQRAADRPTLDPVMTPVGRYWRLRD